MRERGSAVLTAVIAITVLFLITGALFQIVNYSHRIETSEEKGLRAYYLAEAGTNYGIALVKTEVDAKHSTNTHSIYDTLGYTTNLHKTNPLGADYPGGFEITITINKADIDTELDHAVPPNETFVSASFVLTVESTGYYPNASGIKRTLTKQYTFTNNYTAP